LCLDHVLWKCEQAEMQLVSWKNRNLGLDPTEVHLNTYKNLGLDPTKVHLNI